MINVLGLDWIGSGDPTVIGWTITILYMVAAVLCWCARRSASESDVSRVRQSAVVWSVIALGCLALGTNKQLDLQTALIAAVTGGIDSLGLAAGAWIGQVALCVAVLLVGVVAARKLVGRAWSAWSHQGPALLGAGILVLFVMTQIAPAFAVTPVIGQVYLGIEVGEWLELIALLIIAASSGASIVHAGGHAGRHGATSSAWSRVLNVIDETARPAIEPVELRLVHPPEDQPQEQDVVGIIGRDGFRSAS